MKLEFSRSSVAEVNSVERGVIGSQRDCMYGNSSCLNSPPNGNYNAMDPYWGHGTATTGVIMGGLSALGANMVGVSKVVVSTYSLTGHAEPVDFRGTDYNAVLRGLNAAVASGDDIILVEAQFSGDHQFGALALAADDAFDSGAAVLASNGNVGGCTEPSCSPAVAHKVLAVGDYDAVTDVEAFSKIGSSSDSRFKPDLRTPTNITSVTSVSPIPGGSSTNTGQYFGFNGTSAAGATSAGLASILYDFLYQKWQAPAPGYLYAFMLAFGNADAPLNGVGHLRIPGCFAYQLGSRTLTGTDVDITVPVSANRKHFRAALWWPEDNSEQHNSVFLRVRDPNGVERDVDSLGTGQVRRFVRYNQNLTSGNWTLKLDVDNQPRTPQTVYYTAVVECQ